MQILAWNTQARYTDNEATSNDSGRFLVSDDRKAIANPAAVIDGVYPAHATWPFVVVVQKEAWH